MRLPHKALLLASLFALAGAAQAAEPRIGLAAPLGGDLAILGQQMRHGAEAAARALGAEITAFDTECSAADGESAARAFVAEKTSAVVGFLCTEAIEAALPILTEAGIPVITSGVRANGLTDGRGRTGWLVWRVAPRADAELAAVGDILVERWREKLFAIVDDGTIYGRELAESLRLAAELAQLEPVFVDTFRPQSDNQIGLVGRLRRAGATHVFVGGDRDDVAIMARDAGELDYGVTFAGGEALRASGDLPLPAGTLMIAPPEWADIVDEGVMERFSEGGNLPEGYVVPTHAAVEIAVEAVRRASDAGGSVADALSNGDFQTLVGPISFDDKGDRTRNPFILHRHDGQRFLPAE